MPDPSSSLELAMEREHLEKANRDIAEGEARLAQQSEIVQRLRKKSQSVVEAEGLLETFDQTLQVWREHREQILRRIAYLEGEACGSAATPPA